MTTVNARRLAASFAELEGYNDFGQEFEFTMARNVNADNELTGSVMIHMPREHGRLFTSIDAALDFIKARLGDMNETETEGLDA